MTAPHPSRRFAALLAASLAASGATDALAQADSEPVLPGSQAHVESLLDQYAPGIDLGKMNLPANAFRTGKEVSVPSVSAATYAAGTTSSDAVAARARAQSVLDQYVPGLVTLGDRGIRVAAPGAPVVDTRQTIAPSVDTANASREVLHQLALNETLSSLKAADYARAGLWASAVAADRPKDGNVRQLESLALASNGRLYEAAEAAKAALRQSAPWERTRLASYLPAYDDLFAMIQGEVRRNPNDGKILFLLAYHELMLGRSDDASRTLDRAAEYLPEGWLTASVRARFEE